MFKLLAASNLSLLRVWCLIQRGARCIRSTGLVGILFSGHHAGIEVRDISVSLPPEKLNENSGWSGFRKADNADA